MPREQMRAPIFTQAASKTNWPVYRFDPPLMVSLAGFSSLSL